MPTVIVVDASVLATALVDDGPNGDLARSRLTREQLAAPHLIDLEVASVWRGLVRGGRLSPDLAEAALADLREILLERAVHTALLSRAWELRENLTIYDAIYVALAETLQCPLVTADRRLAKANGTQCRIELLDIGG